MKITFPFCWSLLLLTLFSCHKEDNVNASYFCTENKAGFKNPFETLEKQLAELSAYTTSSSGIYILDQGEEAMIARAWLCENAQKSIDIQYFIFAADNIGTIASDLLIRAANRGVKVRVLVDDIALSAKSEQLLALNEHPNFSIKIYNPNANIGKNIAQQLYSAATNYRDFNQRMHNKTFTVDGKVVITGGRNIADEYFDYDHEYNFRDRDVLLLGKVVPEIKSSFQLFWSNSICIPIDSVVNPENYKVNTKENYAYLRQYACNPDNFWPQVRKQIQTVPSLFKNIQETGKLKWVYDIHFVSDNPGKNSARNLSGGGITTDTLIAIVERAKKSILIQTPYLITTVESRRILKQAIDRGVNIKIITNSLGSTDALEAFNGYQRDREELLETGVTIYEFKPDASVRQVLMNNVNKTDTTNTPIFGLHAKTMVVDDYISVVGTFNFDPRSSHLNTECLTVVHSTEISREISQSILTDCLPENAWHITTSFNPDSTCSIARQIKSRIRTVVPKNIL